MKNKIAVAAVLLVVAAALTLYNIYNRGDDILAQLEAGRNEAVAAGEDYVVAKGKNIQVFNSDVQQIMYQYDYWETGGTYSDAVNAIAEKAVVAYYAEKSGVTVSDAEVRQYVDLQKSASEGAMNYGEFADFVKGIGMTADEYWDAQYNILRMELFAGKFDEYADKSTEQKMEYASAKLDAEDLVILEQ